MMAFILATDFDFITYMSKMLFFFFFFFFEAYFTPMAFLEYDTFSKLKSSCSRDVCFTIKCNARLCRLWSGFRVFLLVESLKVDS